MKRGPAVYLVGVGVLLALAGCGRGFMSGERAAWRHEAEVGCLKSGAVKLGAGVVQIEPIEGPGMCGADFPLKVAALGESSPAISYADDPRPPGSVPGVATQMPRWPINDPQYAPPGKDSLCANRANGSAFDASAANAVGARATAGAAHQSDYAANFP